MAYGVVMVAISIGYSGMWQYIASHPGRLGAARLMERPRVANLQFSAGLFGYVAATLIAAFVSGLVALIIYGLLAIYYMFEHLPGQRGGTEPDAGQGEPGAARRTADRGSGAAPGREPHPDLRALARPGLQAGLAAVRVRDGRHDGQAEAAAAAAGRSPRAGALRAGPSLAGARGRRRRGPGRLPAARWNRSNARAASASGMPGPPSATSMRMPPVIAPSRTTTGAVTGVWARHVGQQVGQHLADPRLVHHRDQAGRGLGADRPARLDGRGVGHGVPDDAGQVGLGQVQRRGPVEPGQLEQLGDQRAHPLGLLLDPAHGVRQLVGPSAPCRYSSA